MRVAQWMLGALHEARVRGFIGRLGSRQLAELDLAPLLGRTLEWLIQDGRHQDVLTQSLRFAMLTLHDNRDTIRGNVQRESPWWLPGFIDDRIVVQMLDRVETLLLEMSLDPDHRAAWRLQPLGRALGGLAADRRPNTPAGVGSSRTTCWPTRACRTTSTACGRISSPRWKRTCSILNRRVRAELGRSAANLASELENDPAMQDWVNDWLVEMAVVTVDENRHDMASLISDTVRSWDAGGNQPAHRGRPSAATCSSSASTARWWVAWWAWPSTRMKMAVGAALRTSNVLVASKAGAKTFGRNAASYAYSKRFWLRFLRTCSGSQTLPFIAM